LAKAPFQRPDTANFLLNALPESEYQELVPLLEPIHLEAGQAIYRQGGPLDQVYFPTTAILSWVGVTRMGERAEVGVVGWEGMLGIPALLGYAMSPYDAAVAMPGEVLRAESSLVMEKFARLQSLQRLLFRYTCAALTQLAQTSVCGLYHTVEQRLCRWLLTAHDRARSDELLLTQEILAAMIGARRPTVSIASGTLQEAGLIRVNRGRVTILNRAGLESATCECYSVMRRAFDLFLGA
jgi:CRP-like cAMP-binding protein